MVTRREALAGAGALALGSGLGVWPALAQSVEVYRMLQNVSPEYLLDEKDMDANKARWRAVIEQVGRTCSPPAASS